jgi:hypothetical protein
MELTPREQSTAQRLGEALVQFLLALEEGAAVRQAKRLKAMPVPPTPPPAPVVRHEPQVSIPQPAITKPEPKPKERGKPEQLLVDGREAAKLLSISARTLWAMSAPRGPLPTVHLGRKVLYPIADLAAVVEKLTKRQR